jgi:hypothetical protein
VPDRASTTEIPKEPANQMMIRLRYTLIIDPLWTIIGIITYHPSNSRMRDIPLDQIKERHARTIYRNDGFSDIGYPLELD